MATVNWHVGGILWQSMFGWEAPLLQKGVARYSDQRQAEGEREPRFFGLQDGSKPGLDLSS